MVLVSGDRPPADDPRQRAPSCAATYGRKYGDFVAIGYYCERSTYSSFTDVNKNRSVTAKSGITRFQSLE